MIIDTVRYFRDQRLKIAGLAALGVLTAQLEAAVLVLLVPLAEVIVEEGDSFEGSLGSTQIHLESGELFVITVCFLVAALVSQLVSAWLATRVTTRWDARERLKIIEAFADASYDVQRGERAGSLQVLMEFVGTGSRALGALITGLQAVLSLVVFMAVAVFLDLRAAVALVVIGGFVGALLRPLSTRVKPFGRRLTVLQQELGQEMAESAAATRELRVFSAWPNRVRVLHSGIDESAQLKVKVGFLGSSIGPVYQYVGLGCVLAGLYVAKTFELIDVGVLGATALLLLRSVSYGQRVQSAYHALAETTPHLEGLKVREDLLIAGAEHDSGTRLTSFQTLTCDGVSFSYSPGDPPAIANICTSFQIGEVVGIIGPSGSGKSTLSQLLLRLRQPDAGRVLVDGTDGDSFSLESWYEHVSLVPQDPILLHGTVRENISFFDPAVPQSTIAEAAKRVGLAEWIETLPEGFDTEIGRAVHDLSGGQIQRIGIARVLARAADVVVLDEPSSALDVDSEAILRDTLAELSNNRLIIIIAHRMSTLSICDRLVVMSSGRIEADGPIEKVRAESAFYRKALAAGTLDLDGAR